MVYFKNQWQEKLNLVFCLVNGYTKYTSENHVTGSTGIKLPLQYIIP